MTAYRRKYAFSLIELIVVMLVLSIGLGTLMLIMKNVTTGSTQSHFYSIAEGLAQERIEEMMASGFSGAAIGTTTESSLANFSDYQRETSVLFVSPGDFNSASAGSTNYKRVDVTVSSKSGAVPISVRLTTLLTSV